MASSPKIEDLKKKFEENPRRYFAPLANEYRKAGEIDQAIAICREYLPQQPGHMSGHIVFGQALFEARQLDEAKTVFETALSLDPENLIALKHLGDITLLGGDKEAAKGWYKRVLEADPRNEEAQAQMKQIDAASSGAPTPVVSLSNQPTQPVPTAKAAAYSAPTVVMAAMKPPGKVEPKPAAPAAPAKPAAAAPTAPAAPAAPPAAAVAPTAEIKLEGLSHGADSGPKLVNIPSAPATVIIEAPVTPPASTVAPTVGLETTAMGGAEAPAMDSFRLEGLEPTSVASSPPAPSPPPAPVAEAAPPAQDLPLLDLAAPAASQPAPPAAPPPAIELDLPAAASQTQVTAGAPPAPTIDLDFGSPPPVPPPAPAPAPIAEIPLDIPAPAASEAGLVDLEVSIPAPPAPPPAPVAEAPAAPVADLPMIDVETPAPAPDAGPFVTETMAELYLQQGHRDEALRVYRALLEQKPGDASLRAKVASLEAPAAPPMTAAPAAPPMPMPVAEHSGPTIRSILLLIAQRRPGVRPAQQNGNAPAVVDAAPPMAAAHPVEAAGGPRAGLTDSLASLWNGVPPRAEEETAAIMLAMAFADGMVAAAAPAAPAGAPSASGTVAPPSSFSFDKFFNQRVTMEHATPAQGATVQSESAEDVAKFTRWLEGLKQQ